MEHSNLNVTEIYASIQGESSFAGLPCVFVRLTGCPLRCRWCDTAYAFEGGQQKTISEILDQVKSFGINLVELTGGEPLAQEMTGHLIDQLFKLDYQVLIETSGSEPVKNLNPKTHIIMDIKCPDSNMESRNHWDNLNHLKPTDEIKFVLANRTDYEWALQTMNRHKLSARFNVLMSCAFGLLQPQTLATWMVEDKISARLNLQQHKYIWNPRKKGV